MWRQRDSAEASVDVVPIVASPDEEEASDSDGDASVCNKAGDDVDDDPVIEIIDVAQLLSTPAGGASEKPTRDDFTARLRRSAPAGKQPSDPSPQLRLKTDSQVNLTEEKPRRGRPPSKNGGGAHAGERRRGRPPKRTLRDGDASDEGVKQQDAITYAGEKRRGRPPKRTTLHNYAEKKTQRCGGAGRDHL